MYKRQSHVYDRERTVGIDLDFRFVDLSGKIDIFYPFPVKAVHHDFLPIKEREEYICLLYTSSSFTIAKQFETFDMLFTGINILVWLVGIGTLLAGLIGVSNIMMVTVRERTREIGVRRAIGAKPFDIISQIMSESLLLTSLAGLIGLSAVSYTHLDVYKRQVLGMMCLQYDGRSTG